MEKHVYSVLTKTQSQDKKTQEKLEQFSILKKYYLSDLWQNLNETWEYFQLCNEESLKNQWSQEPINEFDPNSFEIYLWKGNLQLFTIGQWKCLEKNYIQHFKFSLPISPLQIYFELMDKLQARALNLKLEELPKIEKQRDEKVILMYGLAGTGKTSLSLLINGKDIFNPMKTSSSSISKTIFPEISDPLPFLGIYNDVLVRTIDTKGLYDNNDIGIEIESFSKLELILKNIVYVDKLIVVLNGKVKRFDIYQQQLFKRIAELFTQDAYKILEIIVTHWANNEYERDRRSHSNQTQEQFKTEIRNILRTIFEENTDHI